MYIQLRSRGSQLACSHAPEDLLKTGPLQIQVRLLRLPQPEGGRDALMHFCYVRSLYQYPIR